MDILGYTVPVVAHCGEEVALKASTTRDTYRARLVRLSGVDEATVVPPELEGRADLPGRTQAVRAGSYMLAHLPTPLVGSDVISVQAWVYPTNLHAGRQCIVSVAGPDGGYELEIISGELRLVGVSGSGEVEVALSAGRVLERQWYFVVGSWDRTEERAVVASQAVEPGRAWPVSALDLDWKPLAPAPEQSYDRVLIAASDIGAAHHDHFNGKVDTPRLFSSALDYISIVALQSGSPMDVTPACEWLFSSAALDHTSRVPGRGNISTDAVLINLPTLAVTGHSWNGDALCFGESPEEYNAAYFHEDDLEDCQWDTDLSFEVPSTWKSGVYGISLETGDAKDVVPLIVSAGRAAQSTASLAVLLPTFSYLAYANEHKSWLYPIAASGRVPDEFIGEGDRYVADNHLLSTYDFHTDGTGACFSSWRRPVLNFRHDYSMPLIRGPHGLSADLQLIWWLDQERIPYDVIADDDLHRDGLAALQSYRAVVTGSHPEYWSGRMLKGLAAYLSSGGRLAYVGGNGFYWVTTAHEERPDVVEIRRGLAGTRVWEGAPGEEYHFMTGERGGVWRNRGWPPQRLTGVGFTAQGFDRALPYRWLIDQGHPVAGFIARGVDTGAPLGTEGCILGAAAGLEIDRLDYKLGTPAAAVLVATASGFSDSYQATIEDFTTADSCQGGSVSPLVRSDIVFTPLPGGGATFSVGSISWCGGLLVDDRNNGVSKTLRNVLDRFLEPEPFI